MTPREGAMKLTRRELKEFLDQRVDCYNMPAFIGLDPVSIPHLLCRRTIGMDQKPVINREL